MTNTPLPRRTIVKGAAWSLPVIMAAVAVPTSTASTPVTQACLSFIGSSLTKKSLKFKVKNSCSVPAKNVRVTVLDTAGSGWSLVVPLGDIAPGNHRSIEHYREYNFPDGVNRLFLTAMADNSESVSITLER